MSPQPHQNRFMKPDRTFSRVVSKITLMPKQAPRPGPASVFNTGPMSPNSHSQGPTGIAKKIHPNQRTTKGPHPGQRPKTSPNNRAFGQQPHTRIPKNLQQQVHKPQQDQEARGPQIELTPEYRDNLFKAEKDKLTEEFQTRINQIRGTSVFSLR